MTNPTYPPFLPVETANRLLFILKGANLNVTTDQAMNVYSGLPNKYLITAIYITNCSGSATTAAGGFYTASSKSGAIVAFSQVYSSLTSATVLLSATLASGVSTTTQTANPLYFSLTTPQGSAMTADLYVYGVDLI